MNRGRGQAADGKPSGQRRRRTPPAGRDLPGQRPDMLARIVESKRQQLRRQKSALPEAELKARLDDAPPPRPFAAALRAAAAAGKPAVIAELKRASPSKGVLRRDYRPRELAAAYRQGGASCLSVLTDREFFRGEMAHLEEARAAARLPVLRKDFIVDPYQLYESRAGGADCVLLIAAALDDARMLELKDLALELRMDVLIEIHDRRELTRALLLQTEMLGINNRDLRSFATDIRTTLELLVDVPPDRLVVTESGIRDHEQISRLRAAGVSAFLVGETLVKDADPGARLRSLFFADADGARARPEARR